MAKFDVELFKNKWLGQRCKAIIDYAIKQDGWMTFDELYNVGEKAAINKHKPGDTRRFIKRMIIYRFLLADPKMGLKFNSNFVPLDQQPSLK